MSDDRADTLSDDAFLGGALHLLQPRDGARAGTDAVLLAASVRAENGGQVRVLDAGCGVGAVSLCLAWRLPHVHVTGVEIDAQLCALARQNAARNGFAARTAVIQGDVKSPFGTLESQGIQRESYDGVVANPPYLAVERSRAPASSDKRRAHVMSADGLDAWVRFLATCAAPRGKLWMIHRADALAQMLAALKGRFGGVRLLPLFPQAGAPASRIIVTATKGSRAGLELLRGVTIHQPQGAYTPAVEAVLRQGAALPFDVI